MIQKEWDIDLVQTSNWADVTQPQRITTSVIMTSALSCVQQFFSHQIPATQTLEERQGWPKAN